MPSKTSHLDEIYISLQLLMCFIALKGHDKNLKISEKVTTFLEMRTLNEYAVLFLKERREMQHTSTLQWEFKDIFCWRVFTQYYSPTRNYVL